MCLISHFILSFVFYLVGFACQYPNRYTALAWLFWWVEALHWYIWSNWSICLDWSYWFANNWSECYEHQQDYISIGRAIGFDKINLGYSNLGHINLLIGKRLHRFIKENTTLWLNGKDYKIKLQELDPLHYLVSEAIEDC